MRTMDGIDIVMLTKNSERLLRKCLASVYENVPVRRLIVVDGYSTDSTLDILSDFQKEHGNVVVVQEGGTRGSARQRGLEIVETKWFMFVDSDIILCRNWFKKAWGLIKDGVGAVWGMEIWSVIKNSRFLKLFERVTMKIFELRGGTHDLLVRLEAVKDITIPSHLHTYEDTYIRSWIRMKGYQVIPAYDPYCIHYRAENTWTIKQSMNFIIGDFGSAIRRPQLILAYAFYAVIVLYQDLSRSLGLGTRN